ncbi:MAG: hypothetical protein KDC54_14635, partial [Lewinella sp.]|nr:hypothetical protein [Lewinella sp.]
MRTLSSLILAWLFLFSCEKQPVVPNGSCPEIGRDNYVISFRVPPNYPGFSPGSWRGFLLLSNDDGEILVQEEMIKGVSLDLKVSTPCDERIHLTIVNAWGPQTSGGRQASLLTFFDVPNGETYTIGAYQEEV